MANILVNIPTASASTVALPPGVPSAPGAPISPTGSIRPGIFPIGPLSPANPPPGGQVGVFVTPQSLFTFPAASSIVTMIWNLSMTMFPKLNGAYKNWVLLAISLLIGLLMYYLSETDGQDRRAKLTGLAIAFINSLVLAATALGITEATGFRGPVSPG